MTEIMKVVTEEMQNMNKKNRPSKPYNDRYKEDWRRGHVKSDGKKEDPQKPRHSNRD